MTATRLQPAYNVKHGPLAETYGLFEPFTINTGAQISADMIDESGLRNVLFYTANAPLATKRKGKLLLGIGGNAAFNTVFSDTGRVCQELLDAGTGYYASLTPRQKDLILLLEKSGDVVFVDPKSLELEGQDDEYRHFPIRTAKFEKDVTMSRTPWVNAGWGSGYMLERVMDNLSSNSTRNIEETMVYTINPDHVAEHVEDDEIVARASWLFGSDYGSWFNADDRRVDNHNGLRGIVQHLLRHLRCKGTY